jgi:hypothetical protein
MLKFKKEKEMAKVTFRSEYKYDYLCIFKTTKEIDYVPIIGDIIHTTNKDFTKATFRIKPWIKDKDSKIKDLVHIDFKVITRNYHIDGNKWVLYCEPLPESLAFLLKSVDTK